MLQAGVYRVNVNPPFDLPHAGWGAQTHVYADGAESDLTVTGLYLSDGRTEAVVLDYDLCVLNSDTAAAIRGGIAETLGMAIEGVRVCTTHNHAGAQIEYDYYGLGQSARSAYLSTVVEQGISAAREAKRRARSARFAAGKGECRFAMNRRQRLESGRVVTGADPAGVTDPEVQVFRLDAVDGSTLAAMFTYTAHPTTLGPGNRLLSADYPGVAKRKFAAITGAMPLFLQGAAGNVGPGPDGFTADTAIHRRNGSILAYEAAKVFLSLDTRPGQLVFDRVVESGAPLGYFRREPQPERDITIDVLTREISLPVLAHPSVDDAMVIRQRTMDRLQSLRASHADEGAIAAATFEAKRAAMLLERSGEYYGHTQKSIEAHLLRIGDVVLAGIPLEPFVEIGMEIKQRSVYPKTFFGGYTNGTIAYLPVADAYPDRGYEVDTTAYTPEAARIAIEGTLEAIGELHRRQAGK